MRDEQPSHYPHRREFLHTLGAAGLAAAMGVSEAQKPGSKTLRGVFPIGQTPYTDSDKLDLDGLTAQVRFCNRGKVHGFVWPQIASGWSLLTEPERLAGAEAILAAAKGGKTAIVIGVQGSDIAAVSRYAKHAEKLGADAIVSLPPAGVTDEKVLLDYYQQVSKMTGLPLFLQSQGNMSVDFIVEAFKTIPSIRQVKDEAGNPLDRIADLRKKTNDQLKVFSGNGVRTMVTEMELGFAGHCPYTGLADVYAAAYDLWHAGKRREAFDMFGRILAIGSMGDVNGNPILIARGVFKPETKTRSAPSTGGGRGGAAQRTASPRMDDKALREALNTYLKPFLKG